MSKLILLILIIALLSPCASAVAFDAPPVPGDAGELVPSDYESFTDGLLSILQDIIPIIQPSFAEALRCSLSIISVALLIAIVKGIHSTPQHVISIVGTLSVSMLLLGSSKAFIGLASDTVRQISDYGKLLLPVMSASLAAQGGAGTAIALHTATVAIDAILGSLISHIIIPAVILFLFVSTAYSAVGEELLKKVADFCKWLATWMLKTILYVFTGYMAVTGVVSGSADAAALKAAKLTISGAVPVVGGILSDASEAILVSASLAKNAAGIYGLLAFISIAVLPFVKIGIHYLLLKVTTATCGIFGIKSLTNLLKDYASAMGLLLGMTGAVSLLMMISTVCFMRGIR